MRKCHERFYYIDLLSKEWRRKMTKWLLSWCVYVFNRTDFCLCGNHQSNINQWNELMEKHLLRSDILSLKEKEQIHNDISKDEETEEKTKLQQTDILMNECQLAYWEEKSMVISMITTARLASSNSLSILTNCQISKITKVWITIESK